MSESEPPSSAQSSEAASHAVRSRVPTRPRVVTVGMVVLMAFCLLTFVVGDLPMRVLGVCVLVAGWQGLTRGLAETLGVLVGLVLAAVVALPLAKVVEPLLFPLGLSGLLGRVCAYALVIGVSVGVCVLIGRGIGKRLFEHIPALAAWDKLVGGAVGAIYGVALAVFLLVVPLALQPVASAMRSGATTSNASEAEGGAGGSDRARRTRENPAVALVLAAAERISASSMGPTLAALNPLRDLTLLNLAADFAVVAQDAKAMEYLLATPVFRELADDATMRGAADELKTDPELRTLVDRPDAITPRTLAALATSPVITHLIDRTPLLEVLRPRAEAMMQAIREARQRVGTAQNPPTAAESP